MKIKIYNTLTGKKDEFKPIRPGHVGMYVCGPTVYGFDHLGHARTYVFFDILARFFRSLDYEVTYVQNITDVGHLVGDEDSGEDKLEKQAKFENKTPQEIASFYESAHFEDMEKIDNIKPNKTPRASEYIPQIIDLINILLDKKLAYVTDKGNVYFDVQNYPEYGKLSHRNLTAIKSANRVKSEDDKHSPVDFGLWKASSDTTTHCYNSPWSKGIPGWHIECSVMSRQLLGQPFDIHGSAVEHVFPHHENEIAQSEGAYGVKLANWWVHTGMLLTNGQKMSKSQGNSIVLREVLQEKDPMVLRLMLMSAHYRKPLEYREDIYDQWKIVWQNIKKVYTGADSKKTGYYDEFINYLADDMNLPGAINYLLQSLGEIGFDDLDKILNLLGIKYILESVPENISLLLKERQQARDTKNWELSDQLRSQIEGEGYIVEDTPEGTKIINKS